MVNAKMLQGHHLYAVATGAGAKIQQRLWMTPGTSSFLVGCAFPYATDDTDEFLGFKPEKYCSREEAIQLAMEAYVRAARHAQAQALMVSRPVGLAVTASVASILGPAHRGEHRVHVAVMTEEGCTHFKVALTKGAGITMRSLDNHETEVTALSFLEATLTGKCLDDEKVSEAELREIFFKHPFFSERGFRASKATGSSSFYPGTFNPLHDGHREIAKNGSFEDSIYTICFDSVHKPALTVGEALKRAAQFRLERISGRTASVLFTQGDPFFIDKFKAAESGSVFVMGVDTFERMMDPKWGVDPKAIIEAIIDNDITIFVNDRIVNGVVQTAYAALDKHVFMTDISPPEEAHFLIGSAEASELSSTALRAANTR